MTWTNDSFIDHEVYAVAAARWREREGPQGQADFDVNFMAAWKLLHKAWRDDQRGQAATLDKK